MTKPAITNSLLRQQAELRRTGLLAAPGERWTHPSGGFYLEALPYFAQRRQRSDRITRFFKSRLGLA